MENKTKKATFFNNHPFVTTFGAVIITIIICSTLFTGNNNPTPEQIPISDNYQLPTSTPEAVTPKTTQSVPVKPKPTPVQSVPVVQQPTKSWHTAFVYKNNLLINSTPFTMSGTQWRVSYSCSETDSSKSSSMLTTWIKGVDHFSSNLIANTVQCPASSSTYVYGETTGQYYLDMETFNSTYTITVEDYY